MRASPARVDFDPTEPGTSTILPLEIWNDSDRNLEIYQAAAEGEGFSLRSEDCTRRRLAPGRSCVVNVRFSPPYRGSFTGTITVVSSEREGARLIVPLRGEGRSGRYPRIEVDYARLDFGEVEKGNSKILDLQVRNGGPADLELLDAVVEGDVFRLQFDNCSGRIIAPGRTCRLSVRFVPDHEGSYGGNLGIISGDPENQRLVVPLRGESPSRRYPEIRIDPDRLDFGNVAPGDSRTLQLEIGNRGRHDLDVQRISAEGRGFDVPSDTCSGRRVSPGRSCAVAVRFAPDRSGRFSGSLAILSDDPARGRLAVPLSGQSPSQSYPGICVSPSKLDFGKLAAGRSKPLEVRMENEGRTDLEIRGLSVDGEGFEKTYDPCAGKRIPPGRTCSAVVTFSPGRGGDFAGNLTITSSDRERQRVSIPLRGEAIAEPPGFPRIRVSPTRLDFGNVRLRATASLVLEVSNEGNADLDIRETSVEGRFYYARSDGCSGRSLPPGRSCEMGVSFTPEMVGGPFQGSLNLLSNDPESPRLRVALAGAAVPPEDSPSPCPVQRLDPFGEEERPGERRGAEKRALKPFMVKGNLPVGGCDTYAVKMERKGVLSVCVPPGYSLRGEGFQRVKEEGCSFEGDPAVYARYQKGIEKGGDAHEITITRGEGSPRSYRIFLIFQKKDDRED